MRGGGLVCAVGRLHAAGHETVGSRQEGRIRQRVHCRSRRDSEGGAKLEGWDADDRVSRSKNRKAPLEGACTKSFPFFFLVK